jgi:hypothetical protein
VKAETKNGGFLEGRGEGEGMEEGRSGRGGEVQGGRLDCEREVRWSKPGLREPAPVKSWERKSDNRTSFRYSRFPNTLGNHHWGIVRLGSSACF